MIMLGRTFILTCQNSTQMHPTKCGKGNGIRPMPWGRPFTEKDWVQSSSKLNWEFAIDYVAMRQVLFPYTFVSPNHYLSTDVLHARFIYLWPTVNNSRDWQCGSVKSKRRGWREMIDHLRHMLKRTWSKRIMLFWRKDIKVVNYLTEPGLWWALIRHAKTAC